MKERFLLIRIIKKFENIIWKSNIQFETFIILLRLKLELDDRKELISSTNKKKISGVKSNWLMQALIGLFMGIIMTLPFDLYFKVSTVVGMNVFFLVMYMVSDFSSVLLDTRDSNIIMTKPVDHRTMNAARIVHIVYYMMMMFLALNAFSILFGAVRHGILFVLSYFIMMVLLSLLIVFLTTLLYSVLLERFNGEKLKDIINGFQILLSIVTVVAYQFMGRVFEFVNLELVINIRWWTYLLPTSWFAGLFKVIVEGTSVKAYWVMAFLSVSVPVVLGFVLIKWILPEFERYLLKLQIEDGVFIKRHTWISRIKEILYTFLAADHTERAFMRFADANLSRDRKIKLLIAPNQALGIIFPILMLLPFVQGSIGNLSALKGTMGYLTLYLSGVLLVTNYDLIKFSDKHEASFIYDSFPLENKSVIIRAAVKAYFVKYMIVGPMIMSVLYAVLFGGVSVPGILFINLVSVFTLGLKALIGEQYMPFSQPILTTGNKNVGAVFLLMGIMGGFAAFHWLVMKNSLLITGIGMVAIIIAIKWVYYKIIKRGGTHVINDNA